MRTDELNYDLPQNLIAKQPAQPRDSARLMVVDRKANKLHHKKICDLASDMAPGLRDSDLLVVNQTKVLPAYFTGSRANTGGKIEGLYISSANESSWIVMLESRGKLQAGERILLDENSNNNNDDGGRDARPTTAPTTENSNEKALKRRRAGRPPYLLLEEKLDYGKWRAKVESEIPGLALLHEIGTTPLPPYIRKARKLDNQEQVKKEDSLRYNTVYSKIEGSLAAPTAGLHFTDALLDKLNKRGVKKTELTLHVGLGTFAPVRTDNLQEHQMHSESICVPLQTTQKILETKKNGGRVIAVGTTSVRAMESLPENVENLSGDYVDDTNLFIHPESSFKFRFTDGLLTNFHLPKSTLLAMVATLPDVGLDKLLGWYKEAIENEYRFYSYGDAMLIL